MTTLTLIAVYQVGFGVVVSGVYRVMWGGPWSWRHLAFWEILHGTMMFPWVMPPTWILPPARHVEAARRLARARAQEHR